MADIKKVAEAMREVEEKSKAFTVAHQGESAEEILAQMRGIDKSDDALEKKAEEYRIFREECGIKDRVMLNEIEMAYYEGAKCMLKQFEKVEGDELDWFSHHDHEYMLGYRFDEPIELPCDVYVKRKESL